MKLKIILLTGISILIFIIAFGYQWVLNSQKNGFIRLFSDTDYSVEAVIRLPTTKFYFVNEKLPPLYLTDIESPGYLFSVDSNLKRLVKTDLMLTDSLNLKNKSLTISISDTMTVVTGQMSGLFTTLSGAGKHEYPFGDSTIWIDQTNLFSDSAVFCRKVSSIKNQLHLDLIKLNYKTGTIIATLLLARNNNEVFVKDGILSYDNMTNKVFYVYFRMGEFVCMDTNLNIHYRAQTIDTITQVSKTSGSLTQTVNRGYTLFKDNILVCSALKANNERVFDFLRNQVIDVYAVQNGAYRYSFYIPKYRGEKLIDFYITNTHLYAIFGSYLVKYVQTNAISQR